MRIGTRKSARTTDSRILQFPKTAGSASQPSGGWTANSKRSCLARWTRLKRSGFEAGSLDASAERYPTLSLPRSRRRRGQFFMKQPSEIDIPQGCFVEATGPFCQFTCSTTCCGH